MYPTTLNFLNLNPKPCTPNSLNLSPKPCTLNSLNPKPLTEVLGDVDENRVLIVHQSIHDHGAEPQRLVQVLAYWEFPTIWGALFWGPYKT